MSGETLRRVPAWPALPLVLVLALASCAVPPAPPAAPRADAPARGDRLSALAQQRLRAHGLKPHVERPLSVETRCEFKDVAGGSGRMDLHVAQSDVRRFVAEISIPNRGVCAFDLKDFRQSAKRPNVELSEAGGACVVRMWEQGDEVTVAFNGCARRCSGDAFTYLWPVLVDSKSGRCS